MESPGSAAGSTTTKLAPIPSALIVSVALDVHGAAVRAGHHGHDRQTEARAAGILR
jgi:hypothetical protein